MVGANNGSLIPPKKKAEAQKNSAIRTTPFLELMALAIAPTILSIAHFQFVASGHLKR